MGNQLVGIAPSQIFPVERYLTDHPDLKFDVSLGSTRFFKVARAESQEGLVVVKVFAIHDPSLPLSSYKDQLDDIRKKLSSAVNCIPFQKIILTDKAGLIIREYIKYSLYDRISTRPFLTNIEKRWITFQILYALHQCHKVGVCHGDIKLENITVTSWNWVLLVDFASFKPTFVPEDNPADYSYFFDTSRRRTCYIAPERFTKTTNGENSAIITETSCDRGDLTPAMDIFSAGCVLLELWNELDVPFEYSQLLAYRAGKYSPQKHLDKLNDPSLKSLISSMIEIDPTKRLSAEDYLAKERGKFFPEYFFNFLQSYMLIYSSTPIYLPDEKITRLKSDIASIFKFLGPIKHAFEEGDEKYDIEKDKGESEGLVIIIALVTSCIRGLHDCSAKLCSLEILLELSNHANDETILDRILPFIMYLARDNSSRVKISAINTITKCLDLVQQLPKSDSNIFPEYVLPGLAHLAADTNTCVRAAYAKNIAALAEIALRYLDQIQNDWYDNNVNKQKYTHTFNYELELQALHEMVEQTVSILLTDPQPLVKQTLIENGITKLCVFFGKQKANDVLLSHMITFLNDKDDKQLRGSFFDCIIGVAAYIGWHCSGILTPLLLQGLTDSCEFVTMKSINAMSALTELGLITKPALCELVSECCCFLVHPNLWIQQAVVGFITTTTTTLSVLDVQCKIMPNLSMYMKYPLIQIDKPELLLESLKSPIPRNIYDSVVTYTDIELLLKMLKERKIGRDASLMGRVPSLDWYSPTIKNLFRRLEANGMTDTMEDYLLKMENHLRKINKHRVITAPKYNQADGKIDLHIYNGHVKSHVFYLGESQKTDFIADRRLHRTNTSGSIDTNVNSDWNYSSDILTRHSESTNSGGMSSRSTSSRPSSPPPDPHTPFISTDPSSNISLHERSYIQYKRSNCSVELTKLKSKQQEHFLEALRGKEWTEQAAWQPQLPPPEWHLKGVLVAHLHEHRGSVNRLCTIPDKPLFASCSADGYVRLWDCAKMEGKNIANRSKQHYKTQNGASVTSMAVCDGGLTLGAATIDGSLNILRLDPAGNKMTLFQSRQFNLDEEGFAVDVQCLDSGFQNVLVYATLYGSIIGWDLRSSSLAWKLENSLSKGYTTTFCVDSRQSLLTMGTSTGHYKAWDLRFQLPINCFDQPSTKDSSLGELPPPVGIIYDASVISYQYIVDNEKIKKVINHPTESSWIISSVHGNNKILMWNVETKSLEKILWGSTTPPLSQASGPSNSAYALLAGCIDRNPFVLSGGSDQRLRFWNLDTPEKSHIVALAANDHIGTNNVSYGSRLIDGFHVICENLESEKSKDISEEGPRGGPEQPPAGHRDCITDITLCKASQCFMVSSSRDGIIKVWK